MAFVNVVWLSAAKLVLLPSSPRSSVNVLREEFPGNFVSNKFDVLRCIY